MAIVPTYPSVFLLAVLSLVVIIGSFMYVIEGQAHGFTDIPTGIYWAIVTKLINNTFFA